jgi:short-subunit dehydrogenase
MQRRLPGGSIVAGEENSMFTQKYGPWALIAGGSEGVGASFARKLAAKGLNLVLLARKPAALEEVAHQVRSNFGVQVRTASLDLRLPDVLDRVRAFTDDIEVGMLIYNAGVIAPSAFLDRSLDQTLKSLRLTVNGPVVLAHHFGTAMRERARGGIIILGSMSSFAGSQNFVVYSAAKSFDVIFGEGLWYELRPHGVNVLSLIIGLTGTPKLVQSGGLELARQTGQPVLEPDDAAQEGLDNLENGPTWIAGAYNREWAKTLAQMDRKSAVETLSGASNTG